MKLARDTSPHLVDVRPYWSKDSPYVSIPMKDVKYNTYCGRPDTDCPFSIEQHAAESHFSSMPLVSPPYDGMSVGIIDSGVCPDDGINLETGYNRRLTATYYCDTFTMYPNRTNFCEERLPSHPLVAEVYCDAENQSPLPGFLFYVVPHPSS
eukprot:TRINITY_DN21229_c0_g1_i1.p2 TRINITY_DN21229_c0_g1~~TRINITY_DN21229_c0_g1_i1.p2  ORF type:complete len:152 (-),score=18.58 TRINITY_DN21229_c0_g1_i1:566-1021(-)